MNIAPIEWKISASFDDGSHMVTFPAINKGILLLKKPEMTDIESLIGLAVAARDAQWQAALAEQEPVAQLYVSMETHDMGQSLAPNPPFKVARARAYQQTDSLPVGEYPLYLHPAPTNPAAQERANRDADEFSRYTPKEWVSQERAEPVAPAGWQEAISVIARLLMLYEHRSEIDSYKAAEALLSATPPAPAQPATEPSKPEQAEAPSERAALYTLIRGFGFTTFAQTWTIVDAIMARATPPAQTVQDKKGGKA